jgi:hypothetical protein
MKTILFLVLLTMSIQLYSQYEPRESHDSITFEFTPEFIKVDTSSSNIWQIGIPDKTFFNSGFSSLNAIVTDTIGYYPGNNYSYFDIFIGRFNNDWYPGNIFIQFQHKFDTDTLKDGGYITYSYDNGLSWNKIEEHWSKYDQIIDSKNLYTETQVLANGERGFSGNSNGWISTMICWFVPPASLKSTFEMPGDSLIVRFNFVSDAIDNHKEGWLIDNIWHYSADVGGGAAHNDNINRILIYPLPSSKNITFNLDNVYNSILLELYTIDGKKLFSYEYFSIQEIHINTQNFTPGIYLSKITLNNKEVLYKKILLNK